MNVDAVFLLLQGHHETICVVVGGINKSFRARFGWPTVEVFAASAITGLKGLLVAVASKLLLSF